MIELIEQVRRGVAEVAVERTREVLGNGTAFLVPGGLVTNSHVIRPPGQIDAIRIRFEDANESIRLRPDDFYARVAAESPENRFDYAFVTLDEPEFEGRHRFQLGRSDDFRAGYEVLFLGFPFGMPQLTAHHGYVSSVHMQEDRRIVQIDGSVNGGNSGGPMIRLEDGSVSAIITRAVTGIVEQQFNQLITQLRRNQEILRTSRAVIQVGGIDPIQGLAASQAAMEQISVNLRRSANVGIGYAFGIERLKDAISNVARA